MKISTNGLVSGFDVSGVPFNNASAASGLIISALAVIWGVKKALNLVSKPTSYELVLYRNTLRSKSKHRKFKGCYFRVYRNKELLDKQCFDSITRYLDNKRIEHLNNKERVNAKLKKCRAKYGYGY